MRPFHRAPSILPLVVAALLTIGPLLISSGAAASEGFGVTLGADSPDVVLSVRRLASTVVCYIDGDGNNAYGAGEPVVLRPSGSCSGSSSGRDVRLNAWGGLEPGRRLAADADSNKPLAQPPNAVSFWFYDANGNSRMDHGDTVYANIVNGATGFVDVGDVRMSSFRELPAGSVVAASDPDLSFSLALLGTPAEAVALVDGDDNGEFDSGDLLYLNSDLGENELVEYGDLRILTATEQRPYGTFVRFADSDGAAFLTTFRRSPCFVDRDGSQSYSSGDALILDVSGDCDGGVSLGDIRLTTDDGYPAGSRVVEGEPAVGSALIRIGEAYVSYFDVDQDGHFGPADNYYLDIVATSGTKIEPGDVRLTPVSGSSGGHVYQPEDTEVGQSLVRMGLFSDRTAFVATTGGSSPSAADPVYLNLDAVTGEGVEPGDVRLVPVRDLAFGGSAALATREVLPRFASLEGTICTSSSDQSTYKLGDAVYLSFNGCPSNAATGMARLVQVGDKQPGTVVSATDADSGVAITTASGQQLKFYDSDGDGTWSGGDVLYADLVSGSTARVDVGDLRLVATGDLPAAPIESRDWDVNLPLIALGNIGTHTRFVDSNNDGRLSQGDVPYVDADGTGSYASILDVRLATLPALPEPVETPEPSPPSTPPSPIETPVPHPTAEENLIPDQTLTDGKADKGNGSDEGGDESPQTPMPGVAAILATVVAVLLFRRRP